MALLSDVNIYSDRVMVVRPREKNYRSAKSFKNNWRMYQTVYVYTAPPMFACPYCLCVCYRLWCLRIGIIFKRIFPTTQILHLNYQPRRANFRIWCMYTHRWMVWLSVFDIPTTCFFFFIIFCVGDIWTYTYLVFETSGLYSIGVNSLFVGKLICARIEIIC